MGEENGGRPYRGGRRGPVRPAKVWKAPEALGALFQGRRKRAGLTIEDSALISGTNATYMARLERGEAVSPPRPGFLARVAELYGLRFDELAKAAGLQADLPADLDQPGWSEAQTGFVSLVESFRPMALPRRGREYYSIVHMTWAVSLARRVEGWALTESKEQTLREALTAGVEGTRTADELDALRSGAIELMTWQGDPGFGPHLRTLRKGLKLPLRVIGERIGVGHSMVANLERQTWKRAPTRDLVERLARAFGVDLYEMMERAGYRSGAPIDVMIGVNVHELFRWMVVDLGLRPEGMTDGDLTLWSGIQKQQMIDLALRVDDRVRDVGACVEEILTGRQEEG